MKIIKWLISNSIFGYIAYIGLINNVVWAQNILMFSVWILFLIPFLLCFNKESVLKVRKEGRSVNKIIYNFFDFSIVLLLVSQGWFFYGALYFIRLILLAYIHEGKENENKNNHS